MSFFARRAGLHGSIRVLLKKCAWVSAGVACVLATPQLVAPAQGQSTVTSSATPVSLVASAPGDGSSAQTAAPSCWAIKQSYPASTDGTYWLLTPALQTPQQFQCDMTTDGGGWVLVGRGREDWQAWYNGQGNAGDLLGPRTSFATTQLPSRTIDGLLNGTSVSSLPDGVRVKRARDAAGATWQEVRFALPSRSRWAWTFGAGHNLGAWSFDTTKGSGGLSSRFGPDSAFRQMDTQFTTAQSYTAGFAYGTQGTGTNRPTTFLWSATNGLGFARPYAEVWLRPKLTASNVSFSPIPDAGTTAQAKANVASSWALKDDWGVSGLAGPSSGEGHVEVSAFAQIGTTVYVGGNFKYVQKGKAATGADVVQQSFVAAFDQSTGTFLPGFAPTLNGEVKTLVALPGGRLGVGGLFSSVNGSPATGVAALDPLTGQTVAGFHVGLENRVTGGVLEVRSMSVSGNTLYIGGAFTHITGGSQTTPVYSRNVTEVDATTGEPVSTWNPDFNGTVVSVNASGDGNRLYAAGYFTTSNGNAAFKAAALQSASPATLATPAWTPVWSNQNANYQQAIRQVGDRVWVGGAEHALFSFSTATFARLSGNIMNTGGDIQTITEGNGVVYAGCHCNNYNYSDAYLWSNFGTQWSQADKINWIGAWDENTGKVIPDFSPIITSRLGAGAWGSFVDSGGTLWVGGDLTAARTSPARSDWAGGFARFPAVDHVAPTTPQNATASYDGTSNVDLSWSGSSDDTGVTGYEILRDDRVIATSSTTSATVPLGGSNRFFVRAVDAAGNRSASTPLVTLPDPNLGDPHLVTKASTWSYRYDATAPDNGWTSPTFDASGWPSGTAPFGFGSTGLGTNIDIQPTQARPAAAYFTRKLTVTDPSKLTSLTVSTIADDGIVVYVNGVEVGRSSMMAGTVTPTTFASSSRRTSAADSSPVVFSVPPSLLVAGTNTVSAEVHLGYKATPDMSFDLSATAQFN